MLAYALERLKMLFYLYIKLRKNDTSDLDGGFSENILVVSYRFLIKVDKKYGLNAEAQLTDAGLTAYRGIKVRHRLGPGTSSR